MIKRSRLERHNIRIKELGDPSEIKAICPQYVTELIKTGERCIAPCIRRQINELVSGRILHCYCGILSIPWSTYPKISHIIKSITEEDLEDD